MNLTQMTIISTTEGRNPLEEMELLDPVQNGNVGLFFDYAAAATAAKSL